MPRQIPSTSGACASKSSARSFAGRPGWGRPAETAAELVVPASVVVLEREQPAGSNRQHAVAGRDEYSTAQSAHDDSADPGPMRAAAHRQLCRAERPVAEAARCHGHAGPDSGREVMRVDYANDAR